MKDALADPFGGAEFGAGAEEDAGLEDIEGGKVERGEVAFEFAFDAEVEVRGLGIGADGGDEEEVLGAVAAGPLGDAEGDFVVDAAEGLGRAGGFEGGSEGAEEGGGGREGVDVFEVGDDFNEVGMGEAGRAAHEGGEGEAGGLGEEEVAEGAADEAGGAEEQGRLGGGGHWLIS